MESKVEAVIVGKKAINHDCYIFSFEFVNEPIHFLIGQHFRIIKELKTHEHPEGQVLVRKYTPINPCSEKKTIDFLVKIYRPNVHPDFPHGGKYTPFLETQQVGDKLTVEGPFGRFHYSGPGEVVIDGDELPVKRIFFIAGGSGITPIYQTLMEIANNKDDKTELVLLYANRTEEDIVLRKELEAKGDRIKLHFILDKPTENWPHFKGYITHELMQQLCPLDDPETLYAHCGPFPMNKLIREIFGTHYPDSYIFKF